MELHTYVKISEKILQQLPGFISITDLEGNFAWASDKVARSYGFNSSIEIIGKRYSDLRCKFSEDYKTLEAHDQLVFSKNKKMAFVGYYEFADGWKITLCEKSFLFDDNNTLMGLITCCNDMTPYSLIDTNRFVFKLFKEFKNAGQFSLSLDKEDINDYDLSQRQQECLFYLLRGKSDKDIGRKLNLSSRTVESYIHEIKHKMRCQTRLEIIEKSLNEGLLHHYLFQNNSPSGWKNLR